MFFGFESVYRFFLFRNKIVFWLSKVYEDLKKNGGEIMRAILLIGIFLMLLSTNVFAKWGFIPLEELVEDSDLIVVGTLQTVSEYTKDETDFSEGRILVESIIYGNVKTETNQFLKANDKLYLKWQNLSYIACPRIEHKYVLNQKGIWLLKVDPDGSVRADYPGRFVST